MADFDAARRVAEAAGDQFRVYLVNLKEGWTHSKAGDPAAGRELVEEGLRFAEKIGTAILSRSGEGLCSRSAPWRWATAPRRHCAETRC